MAMTGIAAGISACGGSTTPVDAAAKEPITEKHGCSAGADGKHACGGAKHACGSTKHACGCGMAKETTPDAASAPSH
jgi:hypothetical protein